MLDIPLLGLLYYTLEWVLRVAAVFVVPRRRKPTSGMAWLMFIFLLPIPGWIAFMVIGSNKLPRFRRQAQEILDEHVAEEIRVTKKTHPEVFGAAPAKYHEIAELAESLTNLPVMRGVKAQALTHYDQTITSIVDDINAARERVYIEYYALTLDDTTEPLFTALAHAVSRGVDVRVLFDTYGSHKYANYKKMQRRMSADGVRWRKMLPLTWPGKKYIRPDLRNHRKIVIIDNSIGYTGSQNMIDRTYHRKDDIVYDELVIRLGGPIVAQLEAVFFNDWYAETGELPPESHISHDAAQLDQQALAQVLPSGPGYRDENNLQVFTAMVYAAETSITIVNPYFVPSDSLMMALLSAQRRGVKVQIVNSRASDQWLVAHAQRSYYDQLFDAGAEIYLYDAPTLLHSKFIVIDQTIAAVGSSNMDIRSFELNHELTLLSYDKRHAKELAGIAREYIGRSTQIFPEEWAQRSWRKRLLDNLARLTSSLQ